MAFAAEAWLDGRCAPEATGEEVVIWKNGFCGDTALASLTNSSAQRRAALTSAGVLANEVFDRHHEELVDTVGDGAA